MLREFMPRRFFHHVMRGTGVLIGLALAPWLIVREIVLAVAFAARR